MTDRLVVAAAGDALVTRSLSSYTEPAFLRVVDLLRDAHVGFANLETTLHDGRPHAAAQSGGTWMIAPPEVADGLAWAGLNLLARANNHAMDWGLDGMRQTGASLDRLGLSHAGVGEDLAAARQPVWRDTAGGRVALVSATSTFPAWGRAGPPRGPVGGRPGLNPLRWSRLHTLSPQAYQAMQAIAREAGIATIPGQAIDLFGTTFLPWEKTAVGVEAHPGDLAGNLAAVRQARDQADCVIASLHSHEDGGNPYLPSPFAVTFARQCIDHGADLVLMHGAHVLRGIELYRGGAIFYGLGNFIYQAQLVHRLPADALEQAGLMPDADDEAYFAHMEAQAGRPPANALPGACRHLFGSAYSVLPVIRCRHGAPPAIRLHPLTLGPELERGQCGYPRLADGPLAGQIIGLVRELSAPFGTRIALDGDAGVVLPGAR